MKIKMIANAILAIIFTSSLQGCNSLDGVVYTDQSVPVQFSFSMAEQIVEVNANTKFFRVEGRWIDERVSEQNKSYPLVVLDTINTTARHNIHFINVVEPKIETIGEFKFYDSNKVYRDVEILPENITEEVVVHYYVSGTYFVKGQNNNDTIIIEKLKVILRPKID